jgi:hypothetical protein
VKETLEVLVKNNSFTRIEAKNQKIRIRQFYKKVFKGLKVSEEARQAVLNVREVEETVWNHYERVMYKFLHSKKHLVKDFFSYESAIQDAFRDAIYTYSNPEIQFTTYMSVVIKRRISDILDKQYRNRLCIRNNSDLSEGESFVYSNVKNRTTNESVEFVRQAVGEANLTPLQRKLVELYMVGEEFSNIVEFNPKSGKFFTRQGLAYQLKVALERIRKTYCRIAS